MSNIEWIKLKDFFLSKSGLCYFNGNESELITRCPNCESDSSKSHGHLYVKMDESELIYHCFKCLDSGTLIKLIQNYGGDPREFLDEELLNYKWVKSKKSSSNFDVKINNFDLSNQCIDNYKLKIQYLRGRIGFDIDISNIPGLILDFDSFIENNSIKLKDNQWKMLSFMRTNFIGFLTIRGTQVVCRNIDETSSFRYYKLELVNNKQLYKDFYGIETSSISNDLNTVVLCEGPFDLLVPYYSPEFIELRANSCMWASVLSKNYNNSINPILNYCCLSKSRVVVFADKDTKYTDKVFRELRMNPKIHSIDFIWNEAGKDFGKHPIVPTKSVFTFKFFNKR